MKVIFAGSPQFAVPALQAVAKGANLVGVITRPDKPTGRKKILTPTPVKECAESLGVPVFDFHRLREHIDEVKALAADAMITCAYGQILTQQVLDIFPLGVWNLHASLLPKYRGASPVQAAILGGETHTGITVMKTELSLDTGAILLVKRCAIENETCGELFEKLSHLAAEAACDALPLIEAGEPQLLLQDEAKATYCKKIEKADAKINFNNSPQDICRLINAMNPQPLAYCNQSGAILNLLRATPCEGSGEVGQVISADKRGFTVACNGDAIAVEEVLPAGGKAMRAGDFVNGRKIKVGDRLD